MAFRSVAGVQAVSATATITVTNYLNLVTKTVTVGATTLTDAIDFNAAISNDDTATSLASAIDGLSGITASAVGPVITITIDTAGTAGNSTVLSTNSTSALTIVGFAGGVDVVLASSTIGPSGHPIRLKNISCISFATGTKTVAVLNGTASTDTQYDFLTGTASKSVLRVYKEGMILPNGLYIVSGTGISSVTAEFEAVI